MGIDARIYLKTVSGVKPKLKDALPEEYELMPASDSAPEGSTHEVVQNERYYGPGYDFGSWPNLCAAIMILHACDEVVCVWYGSSETEAVEFPPAAVLEMSEMYMDPAHPSRDIHKFIFPDGIRSVPNPHKPLEREDDDAHDQNK